MDSLQGSLFQLVVILPAGRLFVTSCCHYKGGNNWNPLKLWARTSISSRQNVLTLVWIPTGRPAAWGAEYVCRKFTLTASPACQNSTQVRKVFCFPCFLVKSLSRNPVSGLMRLTLLFWQFVHVNRKLDSVRLLPRKKKIWQRAEESTSHEGFFDSWVATSKQHNNETNFSIHLPLVWQLFQRTGLHTWI